MSDKHQAKSKLLRAKAHVAGQQDGHASTEKDNRIEPEIKNAAGNVQEDLGKFRATANKAHQG